MSWYYTREAGADGQVITDEGGPEGVVLTEFLRHGPLPLRVGIELVACMADILTIAEEDAAVHGDLKPGCVYLGAGGSVSIDGYGITRHGGRAPEGRPVGLETDTYGLGVVLHAVLSSEAMGAIPRDRDGHDDAIVDKLVSIDWSDMSDKKWLDPVLHFLCSMLAFDPGERPAPLDVANILGEVAGQVPGKTLDSWARRAVPAEGGPSAPRMEVPKKDAEDLSGPQPLGRAVSHTGGFSRRQAASAKGQCTAFWTREKIAALLDEEGDPEVAPLGRGGRALPPPPTVPPVAPERGMVSSSSANARKYPVGVPMSPDVTITGQPDDPELMEVLRAIRSNNPLPSRDPGPEPGGAHGVRPPAIESARDSWSGATRTRDGLQSSAGAAPLPGTVDVAWPSRDGPPAPPPQAPPLISTGRADAGGAYGPSGAAPGPERTMPWLAIGVGVGGVAIFFGLIVVAIVLFVVTRRDGGRIDIAEDIPEVPILENFDIGTDADTGEVAPPSKGKRGKRGKRGRSMTTGASSRGRPAPTPRATPSRPTPTPTRPPPASRPTPIPTPTGSGGFVVRFRSMGSETRLVCGDGQSATFVGTTRRMFRSVTTCRVTIGAAVGVVQVTRDSSITCVAAGPTVSCRGA